MPTLPISGINLLHVHETWESRDCDGTYSGTRLEIFAADCWDDEDDFKESILTSTVSLSAEGGKLEVTDSGFIWSAPTEDGYSYSEIEFCNRASCDLTEKNTRRDHSAEAAGY